MADHILHLDQSKLTLWKGNYTSFEKQRREQQAIRLKQIRKDEDKRAHLQEFVDRFRAKATKARQAQSRLKMLEKMEPLDAIVDQDVLPFNFPSPAKQLSPPIVAMEGASVGYDQNPVLGRLSLSISNDDRIGLLGSNGNGKSTFAKLVAGRLDAMSGKVTRASKLDVGFFAQHQIDDLDARGTPYSHIASRMKDAPEARVRARCAQIGFPNVKADTRIELLSGGEKARLLMGLATFNGPHLVIMDEPTNHLDIDSRAALIDAINRYEGAIILVSHDRHLLEACADRLWLVANGSVKAFDGDLADYRRFVLDSANSGDSSRKGSGGAQAEQRREAAKTRKELAPLKKKIEQAEERMKKFEQLLARVDEALAHPQAFAKDPARAAQLAQQRAELEKAIAGAEDEWLTLSGEYESAMA